MSQDLQQARYDQLLRRVGALYGPGSKVTEVLQELFPVIDVENVPSELLRLSGWQLAAGSTELTAAVAEFAKIQVFNPVGSGKIATVTLAQVSTGVVASFRWSTDTVALTTRAGTERTRDMRFAFNEQPACQIRRESAATLTDQNGRVTVPAGDSYSIEDPNDIAILVPGSGFEFGAEAANTFVRATFQWRERLFQDSEVNFP